MVLENRWSFEVFVDKDSEKGMFEAAQAFNEKMLKHGMWMECAISRYQGTKGLKRCYVVLHREEGIAGRNAGRKKVETAYGMDEAMRQEAAGKGKKAIAAEMGISLASYYRRRKEYLGERDTK